MLTRCCHITRSDQDLCEYDNQSPPREYKTITINTDINRPENSNWTTLDGRNYRASTITYEDITSTPKSTSSCQANEVGTISAQSSIEMTNLNNDIDQDSIVKHHDASIELCTAV